MIQVKKGLDLPISGAPQMQVEDGPPVSHVALVGSDYHDMKPTLLVAEGEQVQLGQPLFSDKKNPKSDKDIIKPAIINTPKKNIIKNKIYKMESYIFNVV